MRSPGSHRLHSRKIRQVRFSVATLSRRLDSRRSHRLPSAACAHRRSALRASAPSRRQAAAGKTLHDIGGQRCIMSQVLRRGMFAYDIHDRRERLARVMKVRKRVGQAGDRDAARLRRAFPRGHARITIRRAGTGHPSNRARERPACLARRIERGDELHLRSVPGFIREKRIHLPLVSRVRGDTRRRSCGRPLHFGKSQGHIFAVSGINGWVPRYRI